MTWDEGLDTVVVSLKEAARATELVRSGAFRRAGTADVERLLEEVRLASRRTA